MTTFHNTPIARRRLRFAAPVALCLTLGTGTIACSSDDVADTVSEQLAENAAGEGSDVSIDSESGEIEIETDDGNFSMGTSELPDDWAAEIPLPDGYELTTAMQSGTGSDNSFNLTGTVPGDPAEASEEISAVFVADGWEETQSGTSSFEGGTNASSSFDNGTWQVIVGFMDLGDGSDATFSYTVVPSSGG